MKRVFVVAVSLLTLVATESLWAGFEGPGSQNLTAKVQDIVNPSLSVKSAMTSMTPTRENGF